MNDNQRVNPVIPLVFGGFTLLMGALVLGAAVGIVPADPRGFNVPRWVIAAIGSGLGVFGLMIIIPAGAPAWAKSGLAIIFLGLLALVLNYTAFFAPTRIFSSSTSIGPITTYSEGDLGARLICGGIAVLLDAFILWTLIGQFRKLLQKP
jgi:hypothetical protein